MREQSRTRAGAKENPFLSSSTLHGATLLAHPVLRGTETNKQTKNERLIVRFDSILRYALPFRKLGIKKACAMRCHLKN